MQPNITQISKQIIHFEYELQETLSSTFMRFQEYYESPKFKGEIFTIGEFKSWYAQEYGCNTYTRDWAGFNFPDYVLKPFFQGLFDPLTDSEQQVVEFLRYRTDKFYVIGSSIKSNDPDDVVKHETYHALYYIDDEYREKVNFILKEYDLSPLERHLFEMGYHKDVFLDELNAYIGASLEYLEKEGFQIEKKLHKLLTKTFEKHMAQLC